MEALRGILDKVGSKSKDDEKKPSRSSPDASSAYRSSDARGEPDVGTTSYSRDKRGDSRDVGDEPDTSSSYSSRAGGDSGYSRESGRDAASGLHSKRSLTHDTGRDDNSSESMMSEEGRSSNMTTSSSDNYTGMGRRHHTKKSSRQSDDDDHGDDLRCSSGTTGAYVRDDETSEMYRGRGKHGHASHSVEEGRSRDKHTYGGYASADNTNNDYM